jgi:transcriptional regulator with XRE-family HTH domain
MGLDLRAGRRGLLDFLRIRDPLIPCVDGNPESLANLHAKSESGASLVGQDSTAVRPINLQRVRQIVDLSQADSLSLQGVGSSVHKPTLVPLGHGVKGARGRLASVPRKSGELKAPELIKTIGGRFREAREGIGVTQDELADQIGVSRTSVGRFEGGKRGLVGPAFVALLQAAAERGVDLGFVFTGRKSGVPTNAVFSDPELADALKELLEQRRRERTPRTGTR